MDVYIYDPASGDTFELPYKTLTIKEDLNAGKSLNISFDYAQLNDYAANFRQTGYFMLSSSYREIYVDKDGIRKFSGVISEVQLDRGGGEDITVTVAAIGYFGLLAKRFTGALRVFSGVDAGEIAWTLIDESQQDDPPYSDFGITLGHTEATKDRDRTFRFANIKDEITQMTNNNLADGFDCEIDDNKAFNYYASMGSQRSGLFLDINNITKITMRKPLILSLTNKVHVLGQDDDTYSTRTSPGTTYKSVFKTLEAVLAKRDVKETTTLDDYGDKLLIQNQSPTLTFTVSHHDGDPDINEYSVGDSMRLTFDEAEISRVYYRVIGRTIQHTAGAATEVTLSLRLN
jgi:hypothetical protein